VSTTAGVGLGPHTSEEHGVGAPGGLVSTTAGVGLGPHTSEEHGVGAPGGLVSTAAAIAARPRLWPVAITTAFRLARRGWWRRWPLLPVPDTDYWRFRMVTAYGGSGSVRPVPRDVVDYLDWCRRR